MKIAQLYPNRITVTYRRNTSETDTIDNYIRKYHPHLFPDSIDSRINSFSLDNLKRPKSSLNLSASAKRLMRDSINSIYMLSPARTIFRKNRNPIYNYRMSFITLTLPSEQTESDTQVKEYLNLFLTDLRRVYNLQNYVWRAEIQQNGNLHFHLVIDVYIDYNVLLNYWLKALRHSDQVKNYRAKFSKMSYNDYVSLRFSTMSEESKQDPVIKENIKNAYVKGMRSNWSKPNCVDVRSVRDHRVISSYLSKYLCKESAAKVDPERVKNIGKCWARSQSLSRLKYRFPIVFSDMEDKINALKEMGALHTRVYDWAIVHYFNFKKMTKKARSYIDRKLLENANTWNYPIPI